MKRIIVFILGCIVSVAQLQAQEFTAEYNLGYGTYRMSNMKEKLSGIKVEPDLVGLRATDNFSGYMLQDARIGFAWKKHHAGVLFSYMNTAGRNHLADYSGEFSAEIRLKGYKTGAFYRFTVADGVWGNMPLRPYVQLSTGMVANRLQSHTHLLIDGTPIVEFGEKMKGTNFFLEPAIGAQLRVCKYAAVNLSIGYEWDPVRNMYDEKTELKNDAEADWSGLRVQAGLIFYMPLKNKTK